jgi:hypothetical protein
MSERVEGSHCVPSPFSSQLGLVLVRMDLAVVLGNSGSYRTKPGGLLVRARVVLCSLIL